MAFTVEDGTVVENANAYITQAYLEAYWADFGTDLSSYSDDEKQQAIIKATAYVEQRFSSRFLGNRYVNTQELSWPRSDVVLHGFDVTSSTIPTELMKAVAEYAHRAFTTDLLPDPSDQNVAGEIKRKKEKVGPVEQEIEYEAVKRGGIKMHFKTFPSADLLMSPLLRRGGQAIR